jgi:hypothetical protein
MSSGVGTISTGLIAARIFQSLNGALGHAGWRWMFLVASICTFPIAVFGAVFFPGALRGKKRWFLTQAEHNIAVERMRLVGRKAPQGLPFALSSVKRFVGRWHFWVLIPWNIIWILGMGWWQQHILWLRAQPQYDTVQVNNYTVSGSDSCDGRELDCLTTTRPLALAWASFSSSLSPGSSTNGEKKQRYRCSHS